MTPRDPIDVQVAQDNALGGEIDILVVEDNADDQHSIVTALQSAIQQVRIAAVHGGTEALDYLLARGEWSNRAGEEPPKLILLDLDLDGSEGGISVLGQIRTIEPKVALTVAPIVIFTDSHDMKDIKESYRCGANSYIIKPLSHPDFKRVVETVGQYWMKLNKAST